MPRPAGGGYPCAMRAAMEAGAQGFIPKAHSPEAMLMAVQTVLGQGYSVRDWMQLNRNLFAGLKLEKMGLKVGSVYEKNSDEEAGTVISTDPKAGSKVSKGKSVDITVSKGKKEKKSSVPDVTGLPLESARSAITSAGFRVGGVSRQASKQSAGTVISQTPSGGSDVADGAAISLVIAEESRDSSKDNKDNSKNSDKGENAAVPGKNESSKTR